MPVAEIERSSSLISHDKLIAIHAAMVRCCTVEQRIRLLIERGKLRSDLQPPVGREASTAAFVVDLQPEDAVCVSDKDVLPGLVKGASLEKTLRPFATTRTAQHREHSPAPAPVLKRLKIVPASDADSQIDSVRECALSAKRADKGGFVLAFPMGGAESRAKWDAAMSFLASKVLPVVFVVHHSWRAEAGPAQDAMINGIPSIAVDGADAVAIYRVAYEAITRARQGRRPTLVECITVKDSEATAPASGHIHLRSEHGSSGDPTLAMENYLRRKGLWNEESHRRSIAETERDLDLATEFLSD
jgi:pyruvate dehydrogenase E1 component alpha subunit